MGAKQTELSIEIETSARRCFDVLIDYESFPQWQGAVRSLEVLSRDTEGRGKEVAFVVDAEVKTVSYTLVYDYDEPYWITWQYGEGGIEGEFLLEATADGHTRATYVLAIDHGMCVPSPVASTLGDQGVRTSLEELKQRAERSDG